METNSSGIPLLEFVYSSYNYGFHANADERTTDWPLMNNGMLPFIAPFSYTFAACWLGPWLMKGRKPYSLQNAIKIYNIFQICFNGWMISMAVRGGWFNGYSFTCQPMEKHPSQRGLIMAEFMWWYMMSKYVDFIDTAFFILRKKYTQISFLHIGHHGGMTSFCWFGVKFLPGGHVTFAALANCFIHVIMYAYYFLSGMGPSVQKYLWWKRYLTALQMMQFIAQLLHEVQLLVIECDYPVFHVKWAFVFVPCIFILFLNFYLQTFLANRSRKMEMEKLAKYSNLLDESHVVYNTK